MIGIFKNNNPFALLLLALLAFLSEFSGHALVTGAIPTGSTVLFDHFYKMISWADYSDNLYGKGIKLSVLFLEALLLNKIITDQKLVERPGFIPAMAFLMLNALLPFHVSTTYLILNGAILLVLKMLIRLYKQLKPNNQLLLIGFIVGSIASLNTSYLILYAWITVCIMIMRPASIREWLISSLGFLLPYYFMASVLYLMDKLNLSILVPAFSIVFKMPELDMVEWIKIILFALLPWLGMITYNKQIGKMLIQGRKAYLIMLLLNLTILLICILSPSDVSTTLSLMLVPSTLLFAPFFLSFKNNFIPNLVLLALIVLSLLR